jgi:hypothetical protein
MGALAADRLCKSQAEDKGGMSNRNKIYSKGRIPGQWTALRWEVMDSAAWKHMSLGARLLYIVLIRPLSFTADNNGKIFLATRKAAEQLGTSQRRVCVWFRELEHYGFIVLTEPGTSMRAARWRITDAGWGKLDGKGIEPTKDYLKWEGVLFERHNPDGTMTKSSRPKFKKGEEKKSSLRGLKVLRRVEEKKSSTYSQVEEKKSSEGATSVEEKKSSDLGQPSPCAEGGECTGGAEPAPKPELPEWTTPELTEIPYTPELRRLYREAIDGRNACAATER